MLSIKKVNILFLTTVLLLEITTYFGVMAMIPEYSVRMLFSEIILCGPMIFIPLIKGKREAVTGGIKKIKIADIFICIAFYILTGFLMVFINTVSLCFFTNRIAGTVNRIAGSLPIVLVIIIVAVVPAVMEELAYRGIAGRAYSTVSPLGAILLSSFIFGLFHGNLNQFSYAFIMGIVFSLLNEATGTVLSSIIVHFLTNAVSTVKLVVYPAMAESIGRKVNSLSQSGKTLSAALLRLETGVGDDGEIITQLSRADAKTCLPVYAAAAVVGSVAAFMLLKVMARRNGRTEQLKSAFKWRNSSKSAENMGEIGQIFTFPLVMTVAVLLFDMIAGEFI